MQKIGGRVMALRNAKDGVAYVYGVGTYEGDFPYLDTDTVKPLTIEEQGEHNLRVLEQGGMLCNPRIRLDSGKCVWGCECWWGSEASVRKRIDGLKVVEVDIDGERAEAAGQGIPSLMQVDPPAKEGSEP